MAPFEQYLLAERNAEIALAPELFQKRKSSSTVTRRLAAFFCIKMLEKAWSIAETPSEAGRSSANSSQSGKSGSRT
jgi:hypothetical protein